MLKSDDAIRQPHHFFRATPIFCEICLCQMVNLCFSSPLVLHQCYSMLP